MVDTIQLSAGTADGAVINTDDIGGVHTQIIKLGYGALDALTIVSTTNGLPVQIVSPVGAGTEAAAIRVTLATDSTGVVSVDDNGGNISVDWNGTVPPIGAGTEAAALRVTIATDSTGVVSIDDNGGAITVDGTVAVTNAGLTALNGAIAGTEVQVDVLTMPTVAVTNAGITTIAGAVAGTEMQVDVLTLPAVTIAAAQTLATVTTVGAVTSLTNALPAGTNAIGKLAANSGVDIGDVDVTSISAGTNLIGDVDIAPRTTGGWSVGNYTSGDTYTALTNGAQVIKASAGKFGGYYYYNPNAAVSYIMIYNVAAASVTVGTTTAKLIYCLPANSGANIEILAGIPFDTAMSVAAATTAAGNTAPTTALEVMIYYK